MYDDYLFYVAPRERIQKMVKPAAHVYFRKVANKATEIIGPSLKVVEFLRRCGVERHINIIPNTVDLSDFMPENVYARRRCRHARTKLGIRAGDTAMCFVGRLGKEKSIDVLVDFFAANISAVTSAYKLFIIGDGPEKDNLRTADRPSGRGSSGASAGPHSTTTVPAALLSCLRPFHHRFPVRDEFHLHAGGYGQRPVRDRSGWTSTTKTRSTTGENGDVL